MGTYDGSYVGHTIIANFYCASVEDLLELVVPWEMSIYQLKEFLTYVRLDNLTVWWSKPYDLPASLASSGVWRIMLQSLGVSASLESFLIISFCFVEYLFR